MFKFKENTNIMIEKCTIVNSIGNETVTNYFDILFLFLATLHFA